MFRYKYLLPPVVLALCVLSQNFTWAKAPIMTPPETPVLGQLDSYLIENLYKDEDKEAGLDSLLPDARFQELVKRYNLQLFSGPMLGCVTDSSARMWVRTAGPATVQVVVGTGEALTNPIKSNIVMTTKEKDYTALLDVTGLSPQTTYYYDVLVEGKSRLPKDRPQFRTFPAKGQKAKVNIVFGGGARYVPEKERMWDTIAEFKPDAFLWLGDNIYIDQPKERNMQRAMYYRRQLRPEFRRLTASTSNYAIYDDHDFGVNDCAGGLDPFNPEWKVPSWRVFRENWVNPYYGGGEEYPGCWCDFSIGDIDVIMVDNRYYRDFKKGTMLGPKQKQWLLEKLKNSKAKFKVIASGTLWTETADKGGKDSWFGVPEEREAVFSFIDENNITGVILLSADRHRSDIYRIKRPNGYDLYEFESSKLTNNHTHGTKPQALFSYNKGNFFGMLSFDLTKDDPEMTFKCISIDGETIHTMTLKLSELQKSKAAK